MLLFAALLGIKWLRQPTTRAAALDVCTVPKSVRVWFLVYCPRLLFISREFWEGFYYARLGETRITYPPLSRKPSIHLTSRENLLAGLFLQLVWFSIPIVLFLSLFLDIKLLSTFVLFFCHTSHKCPLWVIPPSFLLTWGLFSENKFWNKTIFQSEEIWICQGDNFVW